MQATIWFLKQATEMEEGSLVERRRANPDWETPLGVGYQGFEVEGQNGE